MLCIKKRNGQTHGRTDGRTHKRPRSNMPLQLLRSWGHNDKQCRSRSVGFWRSKLIWIYTVCKDRVYPDSAGLGLKWAATLEMYLGTWAPSDDSDQPAHSLHLIRIITWHILDSQECEVFSCGQWRWVGLEFNGLICRLIWVCIGTHIRKDVFSHYNSKFQFKQR